MDKQKLFIIGALIIGLIAGYFIGREHLKYEMRSAIEQAFSGFGKGMQGIFDKTDETETKIQTKATEAKINKEKEEYATNYLEVYDISARYSNDYLDGKVAVVFGKVKNKGNRTLNRVQVTAYFLDNNEKNIYENSYPAVLISGYSDKSPLRPNYIREFGFKSKNCPREWEEGRVRVAITDIEFE